LHFNLVLDDSDYSLRTASQYEDADLKKYASVPSLSQQLFIQAYRHFLLRLPSMYFSRVVRLFKDARVKDKDMVRLIEDFARDGERNGAINVS